MNEKLIAALKVIQEECQNVQCINCELRKVMDIINCSICDLDFETVERG